MPDLIVENGTIVANANSYATLEEIRSYITSRGFELPIDDDTVSAWAIRAMDYLQTFATDYKGTRSTTTQTLDWPRTGVIIDDASLAPDYMPPRLQLAQAAIVLEINNGVELFNVISGPRVRSERVGGIGVEYFAGSSDTVTTLPVIEHILKPLLDRPDVLRSRRV